MMRASAAFGVQSGYIDSERGGLITEAGAEESFSLFLFDEIRRPRPP